MVPALSALLLISALIEFALAGAGFVAPDFLLTQFGVAPTPDTRFVGHVVAWLLLLVGLVCKCAWHWVRARKAEGWTLALVLGVWWIGIGLGLSVGFGHWENLALDSLKGAAIVALVLKTRPASQEGALT